MYSGLRATVCCFRKKVWAPRWAWYSPTRRTTLPPACRRGGAAQARAGAGAAVGHAAQQHRPDKVPTAIAGAAAPAGRRLGRLRFVVHGLQHRPRARRAAAAGGHPPPPSPHLQHRGLGRQQLVRGRARSHGHRGRLLRHQATVLDIAHAVGGGEGKAAARAGVPQLLGSCRHLARVVLAARGGRCEQHVWEPLPCRDVRLGAGGQAHLGEPARGAGQAVAGGGDAVHAGDCGAARRDCPRAHLS